MSDREDPGLVRVAIVGLLSLLAFVLAIPVFIFNTVVVYSSLCPENCIPGQCELYDLWGTRATGPCRCTKESTWASTMHYCSHYQINESPGFCESHPGWLLNSFIGACLLVCLCVSILCHQAGMERTRLLKMKKNDIRNEAVTMG